MKKSAKPILSIGMIVKNEIRSIEKCLKALQPLRDAIPCELVIADTGSTDGTRELVMQYADIFFDFEWINDFSAARNAVMDKCSGEWYLTVDADEYLDPDITEFVDLLRGKINPEIDCLSVIQRNYADTQDLTIYNDFYAGRIARLGNGVRYRNPIHEVFAHPERGLISGILECVVLWHDGYLEQARQGKNVKSKRNLELLEVQLREDPEDLRVTILAADAAYTEESQEGYARRLVDLLEGKTYARDELPASAWQRVLKVAYEQKLREFDTWYAKAKQMSPNSFFVRIDGNYYAIEVARRKKDCAAVLERGADYLAGVQALKDAKPEEKTELFFGNLCYEKKKMIIAVELVMAWAYAELEQWEDCREILKRYPPKNLGKDNLAFWLQAVGTCAAGQNDAKLWKKFNDTLAKVEDWEKTAGIAVKLVLQNDLILPEGFFTQSASRLSGLAGAVGAEFKEELPGILKARTAQDGGDDDPKVWIWNHALLSAALLVADWKNGDAETLQWLMDAYAMMSAAFLDFYYNPELLKEENVGLLPDMHHFGWLFVQAQAAKEAGDTLEYIRWLRKALKAIPAMKEMIEYLLDGVKAEMEEPKKAETIQPELLALAAQIRTLLAQYDPSDPAVLTLKQSPVYQKVAMYIEDPALNGVEQ